MTEAANVPDGLVIEGRYRIVRRIAEGGMATVYQAMDERLDRTVAIKIMHTQLAQGPHREQFVERFRREAKSAAAIANPHIVQVYDTGEYNGLDYLVMEYVHGVNLRHEMNAQRTFTVRETLRILSETLDGLSAAHRIGVVHRDIKPENILLNDRGRVQITDFGLAKAASQATLSTTNMLLGTAAYLAPEMIEHNQATPQGDLYSVGITAWEMLAGFVPFQSDNPVTLVFKHVHEDVPSVADPCPGIDPSIAAFIAHLTARAVDARPADASEAMRELRELTAHLPMTTWQYRKPTVAPAPAATTALPPLPPVAADSTTPTSADASAHVDTPVTADAPSAVTAAIQAQQTTAMPQPPAAPADGTATAAFAPDATQAIDRSPEPATSIIDVNTTQNLPAVGAPAQAIAQPDAAHTTSAVIASTQVIGAVDTPEATPDAASAADEQPKARTSRRGTVVIVTVIALLIAAIGGGGFAWWYFRGPGSYWTLPQPNDITCTEGRACPITDADWDDYRSALTVADIPYTTAEDFSDTVDEGNIIAVHLTADASAKPLNVGDHVSRRDGSQITVTVSKGVRQATIPEDILDPDSANAKDPLQALQDAGFDNVIHDEDNDQYSETLPAGVALTVSPDPGTTLDHNAEVTVTLSKGPAPVQMPTVEGLTRDQMNEALTELKLTANVTEEFSDSVPSGQVISASVEPGAELHWGDTVDVVVSKGPETAAVPSGLVGKQESEVTKTLQGLGFKVETNRILGGLFGTVRDVQYNGESISDGANVRLRDADGNASVITLTVV